MGTFRVAIELGDPTTGTRWQPVEALVDTGATYTSVPAPVLELLGVDGLALVPDALWAWPSHLA